MGDIPNRIWAFEPAYLSEARGLWESEPVDGWTPCVPVTPEALAAAPEVQALIREAVEAERERCAQVAESWEPAERCLDIAAEIRAGKGKE